MAEIKISASFFWGKKEPEGEICQNCQSLIIGTVHFPIIQYGEASELRFKDGEPKLCHECFLKVPKDKK